MNLTYDNLSNAIQIAAATGNNDQLWELHDVASEAYLAQELTPGEFLELVGDIKGGLQ